jgi:ribonucleotide reductase alpha subunit
MELQDWKLSELGEDIWKKKYQRNGESFEDWLERVSGGDTQVAQLIVDKKFLFGGRILSNRGITDRGVTYSNCYVIEPPHDSIEGIYEAAMKLARTFSYGGGCGVDISTLRPKGAEVHNAALTTSGAVSFMDVLEQTARVIGQNGRRGALMISMDSSHPDIHDFIDAKLDNKLEKCNISVRMSDDDMENKPDILDHIALNNYDWAEPGILYWDTIKRYNLLDKFAYFEYAGVNPCVTGDTLVQTIQGAVAIKDLVGTEPYVYCMDKDGKLVVKRATKVWKTRENAQLVEIDFNRGKLICTPDHQIYTRNRGWVAAKDLKPKDRLNGLGFSKGNEINEMIKLTSDPKYYKHHRFIMEQMGHSIQGKDVHHKDNNHLNNVYSNLEVIAHSKHSILTNQGHECNCPQDPVTGQFIPKECKCKRSKNDSVNVDNTGKNFIVKSVTLLDYTEDVYDLTVPELHNFIANNIVIHNCAEEPLPAGGSCLLGALNLSEFVENPFTDKAAFNIPEFKSAVRIAIRALNDVLDEGLELHPLEEQRNSVRDWRQIGLGIMGFADMLLKMRCQYDSSRALDIIEIIGKTLVNTGLEESALLAMDTESFPECDLRLILASTFITVLRNSNVIEDNTIDLIKRYGLRNSQLFTIAPTGSISTMLGVSGGVEPIFATHYTRKTESLHGEDVYYNVYTPIVQKMIDMELIHEENVDNIATAQNIDPFDRVTIQATWQRFIDASISSTVNVTNDTTVETIRDLYQAAWEDGCKGLTIYRAGCKKEGVLVVDTPKEQTMENTIHIPITDTSIDNCVAYGTQLTTGCGSLWMSVYFHKKTGQLCHIFLDKGSQGGCNSFMIGLSRMISYVGKLGGTVEGICDQLNSVPACPSYSVRTALKKDTSAGKCCPSAIGRALMELKQRYIEDHIEMSTGELKREEMTVNNCPECGAKLNFTGGCNSCPECGYTKCD